MNQPDVERMMERASTADQLAKTTVKLGERIARRDAKIAKLKRTIKRLERELAAEREAGNFLR